MSHLAQSDPEIFAAIQGEEARQRDSIILIASENYTSHAVMEAQGSALTEKYAEGYPGRRYYAGCEFADVVEDLARERLKKLFGMEHANVQLTAACRPTWPPILRSSNPETRFSA